MRATLALCALTAVLALTASAAQADEGQWMPAQIGELDAAKLRELGLELDPSALWNHKDGGLMRAAVNLSGCSAAFVSKQGLIATNHHCAYGAIQAQSTPEHDYLTQGYVAATTDRELEAKGRRVQVVEQIVDVTDKVRSAAAGTNDDVARAKAVERVQKEIVADCEREHAGRRCRVADFYRGSLYQLFVALELRDIRLVFAPPAMVGEYGGEVDNWMWPRHTGDFTILRAYVGPNGEPADYSPNNVPYAPTRWLEVSPNGVAPGDFVGILGYPGRTQRYLSRSEVVRQSEQVLPGIVDLYGEWLEILHKLAADDDAIRIKVAATAKGLGNRHKNARGMLAGIARMRLVERRTAEEQELARWAAAHPDPYGSVLQELDALVGEYRQHHTRDALISGASIVRSLGIAIDLVRRAREAAKPDLERTSKYMARNEGRLRQGLERRLRDYDLRVDTALLDSLARRGKQGGVAELRALSPKLLRRTKVTDADQVMRWFDTPAQVLADANKDAMLRAALPIVEAMEAQEIRYDAWQGRALVLGPRYFEMLRAVRPGPVYPDANGTLRFSYATVQGYSPQEGLMATPQTTVAGAVAKHTGEHPFDLPKPVRDAAPEAGATYWADPGLGDVPACFLSNGDTTGGNSGSPVVDGRGRLVGLNFDRVWENIAGDFGYQTARSRNVSVDARYMLWLLDEVYAGRHVLEELGLADYADKPARTVAPAPTASAPSGGDPFPPSEPPPPIGARRGCRASSPTPAPPSLLAAAGLSLALIRRRRARSCR